MPCVLVSAIDAGWVGWWALSVATLLAAFVTFSFQRQSYWSSRIPGLPYFSPPRRRVWPPHAWLAVLSGLALDPSLAVALGLDWAVPSMDLAAASDQELRTELAKRVATRTQVGSTAGVYPDVHRWPCNWAFSCGCGCGCHTGGLPV